MVFKTTIGQTLITPRSIKDWVGYQGESLAARATWELLGRHGGIGP